MKFIKLAMVAVWMAMTVLPGSGAAQSAAPIKVVLGVPAGAAQDALARLLAERMRADLGRPVIVENRPGAGARLAAEYVKQAEPDGNTLLLAPLAVMVTYPHTYTSLRYDPFKDFVPVAHVANYALAFAVSLDTPAKTLREYVTLVRGNPRYGNYASAAAGSLPHFFGEMFSREAGIQMTHVAYKGTAPALTDLEGGHIAAFSGGLSDVQKLHQAGKLRVLAVASTKRAASLPDVPTFKEQGIEADGSGWYALYAPARTPKVIVDRMAQAVQRAVASPAVQSFATQMDLALTGWGPADLARIQRADHDRWGPVIRASGFKSDE